MWRGETASSLGALRKPVDDAGFAEIVGGHFHFHAVADIEANPAFAHLAGNVGLDLVFLLAHFHVKQGTGQYFGDDSFDIDELIHQTILSVAFLSGLTRVTKTGFEPGQEARTSWLRGAAVTMPPFPPQRKLSRLKADDSGLRTLTTLRAWQAQD